MWGLYRFWAFVDRLWLRWQIVRYYHAAIAGLPWKPIFCLTVIATLVAAFPYAERLYKHPERVRAGYEAVKEKVVAPTIPRGLPNKPGPGLGGLF